MPSLGRFQLFCALAFALASPAAGLGALDRADRVLGQPDFASAGENRVDRRGFYHAADVALDASVTPARLWVSDPINHRVLGWRSVEARRTGAPADIVIGQPDGNGATCNAGGLSAASLCTPQGLGLGADGTLLVADSGNDRVLAYDSPFEHDAIADHVFGQATFGDALRCRSLPGSYCLPMDVAIDAEGTLFVADEFHHRVLVHEQALTGGDPAPERELVPHQDLVAGCQWFPVSLAVDEAGNLYTSSAAACDDGVRVFPAAGGERKILGQPGPCAAAGRVCGPGGLAVDDEGALWVVSIGHLGVVRVPDPLGEATITGVVNLTGEIEEPGGVGPQTGRALRGGATGVDVANGDLVAAQAARVLLFHDPLGGGDRRADAVFGQRAFAVQAPNGVDAAGLRGPTGVAIDRSVSPARLFVLDAGNNRVLGWRDATNFENGAPADLVIGRTTPQPFTPPRPPSARTLRTDVSSRVDVTPSQGIAVDGAGNLYVADMGNHRVLVFRRPFEEDGVADRVLGQRGSFTTGTCNRGGRSGRSLCDPGPLAFDARGQLYVGDLANDRVLVFADPLRGDDVADRVLGQRGMRAGGCGAPGGERPCFALDEPLSGFPDHEQHRRNGALAFDTAGRLWVGDLGRRLLVYDTPARSAAAADRSLPLATDGEAVLPVAMVFLPGGELAVAALDGLRIFDVVGRRGARQLAAVPRGERASAGTVSSPAGVASGPRGALFLADAALHRVVRYPPFGR